jgi:hypothetical protein
MILYFGKNNKSKDILDKYSDADIIHTFILVNTLGNVIKLSDYYDIIWELINGNIKYNILIHCDTGNNLSPSILAYYLLRISYEYDITNTINTVKTSSKKNTKLYDIISIIVKNRNTVDISYNFLKELNKYEKICNKYDNKDVDNHGVNDHNHGVNDHNHGVNDHNHGVNDHRDNELLSLSNFNISHVKTMVV